MALICIFEEKWTVLAICERGVSDLSSVVPFIENGMTGGRTVLGENS